MSVLIAKPFRSMTLDAQIKMHGGRGFTCEVIAIPVKGTYSCDFVFNTPEGSKTLRSVNQCKIAVFEPDDQGLCCVYHDGETDSYVMFREHQNATNHAHDMSSGLFLGKTLDSAEQTLRNWFPRHLNFKFNQPQFN